MIIYTPSKLHIPKTSDEILTLWSRYFQQKSIKSNKWFERLWRLMKDYLYVLVSMETGGLYISSSTKIIRNRGRSIVKIYREGQKLVTKIHW